MELEYFVKHKQNIVDKCKFENMPILIKSDSLKSKPPPKMYMNLQFSAVDLPLAKLVQVHLRV